MAKIQRKYNSRQRAKSMLGFTGSGRSVLKQVKSLRKEYQERRTARKAAR